MFGLMQAAHRALDLATSAPLSVGSVAPAFDLQNQAGLRQRSSDLAGTPFVLVFYPRDDTPICTMQLRDFNAGRETWSASGVRVFGVNSGNARSHASFCERLGLGFDLLVDDGAALASEYRATFGAIRQVRRTVYAIGRDGLIAFAERGTPAPELVLASLGLKP